jgi:hypothetical protein
MVSKHLFKVCHQLRQKGPTMFFTRSILVSMVVLCSLVVGAAPLKRTTDAKVTGVITYLGKPIGGGKIALFREDGQFAGAKSKADGNYTIDRVLTGELKVTITGKGIPQKYADDESTQLVVQVRDGNNNFDFALE